MRCACLTAWARRCAAIMACRSQASPHMSPVALRQQIGQLLDRRIQRPGAARRAQGARARVLDRRRDPVQAERRGSRSGQRGRAPDRGARRGTAAVGGRRPGGRPRRAIEAAVHRMAADDRARPIEERRVDAAVRARAGRGADGGRRHARLRARARCADQRGEPGNRGPRARATRWSSSPSSDA